MIQFTIYRLFSLFMYYSAETVQFNLIAFHPKAFNILGASASQNQAPQLH